MKLSRHAQQTFWDVHAWAGVLIGLVVHVIFFTGVFVLFRGELTVWQDPATALAPGRASSLGPVIEGVVAERALAGSFVDLTLPTHDQPVATVTWTAPGAAQSRTMHLVPGPEAGPEATVPERSRLARFLFHLHFLYDEDVPALMWVTGFLAVAFLLVLVTGLLIHLKGLGRQLFRFRPERKARVAWAELHKVLGTWGLPAQAMFAFTGALICLSALLLPRFVGPVFAGDAGAAERALYGDYQAMPARGEPGAVLRLAALVARAEAATGMRADRVRVHHWGDIDSTVVVYGSVPQGLYPRAMAKLRARDGAMLYTEAPDTLPAAQALMHAAYGLHFASFGGLGVALLYALLGLAGCATILSGNAIWLARREARRAHPGNRLLARLTAAAGGGLALGMAALLAANRILPLDWAGRADAEIQIFVATWVAAGGACLVARGLRAVWTILLGLAGALFVATPVLGLLTRPAGLLVFGSLGTLGTLPGHAVAVVDLFVLVLGAGLLVAARRIRPRSRRATEVLHA